MSLKLLFDYLRLNDAEKVFIGQALAYSYSLLDANLLGSSGAFDAWLEAMKSVASKTGFTAEEFNLATCLFGEWTPKLGKDFVRVYAGTDRTKRLSERTIAVCAVLNDKTESKLQEYKKDWNGFLKLCNVMQFSDAFIGVSEKGLETYTYANFKTP